ncbi:MAG: hypothetical protein IPG50_31195 [Myxococcales bacterium]|nr:hypothetical protein [Myxococcales bacterium]
MLTRAFAWWLSRFVLVDASGLAGGDEGLAPLRDAGSSLDDGSALGADGEAPRADAAPNDAPDAAPIPDVRVPSPRRYAAAVLSDQPALYLPFGESPGATSVTDLTGRLQPTLIGTPQFGPWRHAGTPTAVPEKTALGPLQLHGAETLIERVRIPDDILVGDPRYLVRKGDALPDGGAPTDVFSVFLSTPGTGVNAVFARRAGALSRTTDLVFATPVTGFQHVVAVFTGAQLLMYKNGLLLGVDADSNLGGGIAGSFYIGLRDATSGFARTEIDEIAVYDHVYRRRESRLTTRSALASGQINDGGHEARGEGLPGGRDDARLRRLGRLGRGLRVSHGHRRTERG